MAMDARAVSSNFRNLPSALTRPRPAKAEFGLYDDSEAFLKTLDKLDAKAQKPDFSERKFASESFKDRLPNSRLEKWSKSSLASQRSDSKDFDNKDLKEDSVIAKREMAQLEDIVNVDGQTLQVMADKLRTQKAMLKFMDSMENELGVKPAKIAVSMANLEGETLEMPAQDTVDQIIKQLNLNPKDIPRAKELYNNMLEEVEGLKTDDSSTLAATEVAGSLAALALAKNSLKPVMQPKPEIAPASEPMKKMMPVKSDVSMTNLTDTQLMSSPQMSMPSENAKNLLGQNSLGNEGKIALKDFTPVDGENELSQSSSEDLLSKLNGKQINSQMNDRQTSAQVNGADLNKMAESNLNESIKSQTKVKSASMTQKLSEKDLDELKDLPLDDSQVNTSKLNEMNPFEQKLAQDLQKQEDFSASLANDSKTNDLTQSMMQKSEASTEQNLQNGYFANHSQNPKKEVSASDTKEKFSVRENAANSKTSQLSTDSVLAQNGANTKTESAGKSVAAGAATGAIAMGKNDAKRDVDQIVTQAQWIAKRGGGEMKLKLRGEVGNVDLKVNVQGNDVNVQMMTDSAEAKKLLETHAKDLRNGLESHKLNISDLKIDVAGASNSHQKDFGSQSDSNRQMEQNMERQAGQQFMSDFRDNNQSFRESAFQNAMSSRAYAPMTKRADLRPIEGGSQSAQTSNYSESGRLHLVA